MFATLRPVKVGMVFCADEYKQNNYQLHKEHRTAVSEPIALCCGVAIFLHHSVHS